MRRRIFLLALPAGIALGCTEGTTPVAPEVTGSLTVDSMALAISSSFLQMGLGCDHEVLRVGQSTQCGASVSDGVSLIDDAHAFWWSTTGLGLGIGTIGWPNPKRTVVHALAPGNDWVRANHYGYIERFFNIKTFQVGNVQGPTEIIYGGTNPTFTVLAEGPMSFAYQWQFSWDAINWSNAWNGFGNATTSTYWAPVNNGPIHYLRARVTPSGVPAVFTPPHLVDPRNAFEISMTGETWIWQPGTYFYTVNALGGTWSYDYQWSKSVSSTNQTVALYFDACTPFETPLQVDVTSGGLVRTIDIRIRNAIQDPC